MKKILSGLIIIILSQTLLLGQKWEMLNSGTTNNLESIYFSSANVGYAVGGTKTIIKTTDGGATWSSVMTNVNYKTYYDVFFLDDNTGWVCGSDGMVVKTIDGGTNWTEVNIPLSYIALFSVQFSDANNGFVAGNNGYRYVTTDGGANWAEAKVGTKNIFDTYFVDNSTAYQIGYEEIYKSTDGGTNWTLNKSLNTGDYGRGVFFTDELNGYGTGYNSTADPDEGFIVKTTDGGITWNRTFMANHNLEDIGFVSSTTGFVIGKISFGDNMIYKTIDQGSTWLPDTSLGDSYDDVLTDIEIVNGNTAYVVGKNGRIMRFVNETSTPTNAITSTTAGGNWSETSTWVGGVVPTATDDVVFDGNIIFDQSSECNNLTVNSGANFDGDGSSRTLKIKGKLTNNGNIYVNNGRITFEIGGDFYLNGPMNTYLIYIKGDVNQEVRYVSSNGYNVPIWLVSEISGTNYQWYKDNIAISGAVGQNYAVTLSGSNETADYKCVVDGNDTRTISLRWGENAGSSSTLNGKVTNALDGTPISGALVAIGPLTTTTDSDGNYEITDIPAATLNAAFSGAPLSGDAPLEVMFTDQSNDAAHTVVISATGFSTYTNNQVVINDGETLTMDASLSPTLTTGEMRIVLNWGSAPSDLDSYLKTPTIEGSDYTVYYSNQGNATAAPYATLDHDDMSAYGPETITIYQKFTGTYTYYVHNYSGSPDISTSTGVVQVYTDAGLVNSVNIPTSGTGLYWNVLTIDGTTGAVSVINTIDDSPSIPTAPPVMPIKTINLAKSEALSRGTEAITSWAWSFGDGATSTDQNPTHTYTAAGDYTVTLVASNGTDNATETKTDYISVSEGSTGGDIVSTTTGGLWDQTTTWIGGVVPTASDNVIIDGTVKANSSYTELACKNITINEGDSLFCDNFGSYGVLLKIGGDIINNGTITQSELYWDFGLSVTGNITNNGEFSNKYVTLDGESGQTLTSSHEIEVLKIEMKNGQNLIAGSDLRFVNTYFQFNNGEFIIGDDITIFFHSTEGGSGNGAGHVDKAHIKGGGTIFSSGVNSTSNVYWFNDSTTVENITLTGNIRGKGNFAILGNVVNKDTLQQAEDNYSVTINVFEDFTNKGTIRNNPLDNDGLTLAIHKNFTNEGIINNDCLSLVSETAQVLSATKPIEINRLEILNRQDIVAGSNLELLDVGWVNVNSSYDSEFLNFIIDSDKTVSFKHSKEMNTHVRKINFTGGGTLYCEASENGRIEFEDSTSVENITLTGTISGKGDFRILSNVINNDTLQGCGHQYGDAIIVEEDFVNDGVVRERGGSGWSELTMYIRKNIVNKGRWENDWISMDGTSDQSFTNEGKLSSSFQLNANVSSATTYQWYKDGVAIDGETSEFYKYSAPSNMEDYNPYGEYYCQTNAGNSRTIIIKKENGGGESGVLLSENFDSETFPPNGWTIDNTHPTNNWKKGNPSENPFSAIDPSNVYSAICPWVGEDQDEWIVTPLMNFPDESILLTFYSGYSTSWLTNATLKLHISTDGGATTAAIIWEAQNDGDGWKWRSNEIDLSSYKGMNNIALAWEYVGNDGDLVGIDNVKIIYGTVDVEETNKNVIPTEYSLNQNYPNPFNPSTIISYSLPKQGLVLISIYNVLGQKVATLVNETQNAGNYKFNFDASKLSSGTYIYQIRSGSFVQSKKMLLIK